MGVRIPLGVLNEMKMYNKPSDYTAEINTALDVTLGYLYFMDKKHPLSSNIGRVYHHRHVASVALGKWIDSSYHVHHLDGDKSNNNPSNLEVVSSSEHARLHALERGFQTTHTKACAYCGEGFETTHGVYCSQKCSNASRDRLSNHIDKETLRSLVWEIPTVKLAKELGFSDTAVSKLCKRWGIEKPPRGYWAKRNY